MISQFSKSFVRTIGSVIMRSGAAARLSILIYHRVLPERDPLLDDEIDRETFTAHMDALACQFHVLPLSEAVERLRSGRLPPSSACITFDDGYANNAEVALPILEQRSLPATFFVATGFLHGECMWNDVVIEAIRSATMPVLELETINLGNHALGALQQRQLAVRNVLESLKPLDPRMRAEYVAHILEKTGVSAPEGMMMSPAQVKSLVDAGMEVGAHSVTHPVLTTLDRDAARTEIVTGKEQLEAITGRSIRLFAYPNGKPGRDYTSDHVSMVKETGFTGAVTTAWGAARRHSDPYQLPRFTPWDRTPARFILRLYQNVLRGNFSTV